MINVVVTMIIKEGRMDDFRAVAAELAPKVQAEKGCIAYDYTVDTESPLGSQEPVQPNRVTLLERWESPGALEAHMASPHMKEFMPRLSELRESATIRATSPLL